MVIEFHPDGVNHSDFDRNAALRQGGTADMSGDEFIQEGAQELANDVPLRESISDSGAYSTGVFDTKSVPSAA
jgi:hypothetical protein